MNDHFGTACKAQLADRVVEAGRPLGSRSTAKSHDKTRSLMPQTVRVHRLAILPMTGRSARYLVAVPEVDFWDVYATLSGREIGPR